MRPTLPGPNFWRERGPLTLRTAGFLALLAALGVMVVYHPLVFTRLAFWGSGTDLPALGYPVRAYAVMCLKQGIVPLWNPFIFGGVPFHCGAHPVFYPPLWMGLVMPIHLQIRFEILLHAWLAVASCAWLARYLHCGLLSSLLAGLSFGLGGFFTSHLFAGHLELVEASAYLPLAMLAQIACLRYRGIGWTVLAALVTAWCGLIGVYQALYWMGLLWLLQLVLCLAGRNYPVPPLDFGRSLTRLSSARGSDPGAELTAGVSLPDRGLDLCWAAARLLCCGALATALLAFQWMPQREMLSFFDWPGTPAEGLSAPLINWLNLLVPHLFERTYVAYSFTRWTVWENQPYLGLAGLLALALAFHLSGWRRWAPYAAPALLMGLLACGVSTPVWKLYALLDPVGSSFEVPGRLLGPMTLFLALLQAQGYDRILTCSSGLRRALRWSLGLTVLMCLAWGVLFHSHPENPTWKALLQSIVSESEWLLMISRYYPERPDSILVATSLRVGWSVVVLFYLVLCLRQVGFRRDSWLALLVLLDLTVFSSPYLNCSEPANFQISRDAALIFRRFGPQRYSASPEMAGLNENLPMGVSSVGGYDPLSSRAFDQFASRYFGYDPGERISSLLEVEPAPLWRLQGVSYYLRGTGDLSKLPAAYGELQSVGEVFRDHYLYQDPGAFSRAFVVERAEVASDEQVHQMALRGDPRLSRATFLSRPAPEDHSGPGGMAGPVLVTPNEVLVEARGPGYLVLSDVYTSGWTATVDGQPAEVLKATAGLHRAVGLTPGPHRVRFSFQPHSLVAGSWISRAAALVCVLVLGVGWVQRKARR